MLLFAAVIAITWANSPFRDSYSDLWGTTISVDVRLFSISKSLHHWVNDGLMAIFFFVVGLEIRREIAHGELSDRRRATLPAAAALGGMVLPALIFFSLNASGEGAKGWGIPMATDIAFALGVLALLGSRIPSNVRLILLALAIVDDIGAILVIAVFYTEDLSFEALGIAFLLLGTILVMKHVGVPNINAYVLVGILFWAAVLKSGVHATIAGVVLGLMTPVTPYFNRGTFAQSIDTLVRRFQDALARGDKDEQEAVLGQIEELSQGTEAPVERLERVVHPWSSNIIVPIFALANAGVMLSGDAVRDASSSTITLGIMLGLLFGKVLGITGFAWLAVRSQIASLPTGVTWLRVTGIGLLAGIGFTVSLFITELAYQDAQLVSEAKIGILVASAVAGLVGYTFLRKVTADT